MSKIGGIVVVADMRGAWTEVRDQGARPTCVACAVSDAHAHAHSLEHPLSAEFLFHAGFQRYPSLNVGKGMTLAAADAALRNDGQPNELEWPYQAAMPDPWTPPAVSTLWYGSLEQRISDAAGAINSLRAGMPLVLGLRLVPGFNRVQASPYIIDESGPAVGGHCVLGVGLGASTSGGAIDLMLIRNSWGFRWGFGGHAWLPLIYLNDKLIGSRTLTALDLAAAA
jgi:hypothetical protein